MSELHVHPILGDFYRVDRPSRDWIRLRIFGAGETPAQEQLNIAHRVPGRLSQLLSAAALGKPPSDDAPADWERTLQKPGISWINIAVDGSNRLQHTKKDGPNLGRRSFRIASD
jgi:hypothetical protein